MTPRKNKLRKIALYLPLILILAPAPFSFAKTGTLGLSHSLQKATNLYAKETNNEAVILLCNEAIKQGQQNTSPENRILALIYKAAAFNELRLTDSAFTNINKAKDKATNLNSAYLKNCALGYKGTLYFRADSLKQGLISLNQAIKFFAKEDSTLILNQQLLAIFNRYRGRIFAENGFYSKAIIDYKTSLDYYEKLGYKKSIYVNKRLLFRR